MRLSRCCSLLCPYLQTPGGSGVYSHQPICRHCPWQLVHLGWQDGFETGGACGLCRWVIFSSICLPRKGAMLASGWFCLLLALKLSTVWLRGIISLHRISIEHSCRTAAGWQCQSDIFSPKWKTKFSGFQEQHQKMFFFLHTQMKTEHTV